MKKSLRKSAGMKSYAEIEEEVNVNALHENKDREK
jgi:hypothetical protein